MNVQKDGDDLIVAGTKGGYPTHPQWYRNLQSNPELTAEYHGDSWRARAITVDNGPDRDRLFAMMVEVIPGAYAYQDKCRDQRQIPCPPSAHLIQARWRKRARCYGWQRARRARVSDGAASPDTPRRGRHAGMA